MGTSLSTPEERGLGLTEAVCLSTATGAANVMCNGTQAAEYSVIEELIPKVVWHALPAGDDYPVNYGFIPTQSYFIHTLSKEEWLEYSVICSEEGEYS
ncbi:MAG: hypothetical protein LUI13_10805 [Lachnospiraceae bacterium]|nr:hypothetical protein [Lachnospiraceae bacterium]